MKVLTKVNKITWNRNAHWKCQKEKKNYWGSEIKERTYLKLCSIKRLKKNFAPLSHLFGWILDFPMVHPMIFCCFPCQKNQVWDMWPWVLQPQLFSNKLSTHKVAHSSTISNSLNRCWMKSLNNVRTKDKIIISMHSMDILFLMSCLKQPIWLKKIK